FSPDWVQEVFTTMLKCDNPLCGETIAVSGRVIVDFDYVYNENDEPAGEWGSYLRPVSMYPAPPIFTISKSFPDAVKSELRLAFQLFWTDLSTSASRLRTSLERVLDERGVATTELDQKGKAQRLSLAQR